MPNPYRMLLAASPEFSDLKESDLDLLDSAEILSLAESVKKMRRTAVHGTGSNWVRGEPGDSPYKTDVLVNNQGPQFGGTSRDNFPGAGDMHINEEPEGKSTRGNANEGDFDEKNRHERLQDLLEDKSSPYVVRFNFPDGEIGTDDLAQEIFGEDARSNGSSIYVTVNGYDEAIRVQRSVPGSIIETKGE